MPHALVGVAAAICSAIFFWCCDAIIKHLHSRLSSALFIIFIIGLYYIYYRRVALLILECAFILFCALAPTLPPPLPLPLFVYWGYAMHVSLCNLFYAATDSNPHPSLYINIEGVLIAGYYLLVILIPWKNVPACLASCYLVVWVLRRGYKCYAGDINAAQGYKCIACIPWLW